MKKIAIFTTMLLIISVMSISATETRVLTMGDNNMLLLDEANIFLFPSRISDWPNLVTGEFGNDDFAKLGIHWKFGTKEKPCYLATYFHNNSPELPGMWYNPFFNMFGYGQSSLYVDFDDPTFLASNKRMDLVYGRKLGENMFGVHFGMVHSSRRNNDIVPGYVGANNDSKDDESLGIYKFKVGLTLNEGLLDLSAGMNVISFKDKDTDDSPAAFDETKSKGNREISFMARSFYEYSPSYTFIGHIGLMYGKYEAEYYDKDPANLSTILLVETDKYTNSVVDLGIGMQYIPAPNVLAVIDFGLRYDKLKGEFTPDGSATGEASAKDVTFPYFKVGVDADVFRWMDVRLGATSYWDNTSNEDITNNSEFVRRNPDNETYLGFGFHWNRLHIDTQTDPSLFLRGFEFINGADNNEDMNVRLSIVYEMM